MVNWNPDQYLKFIGERTQASVDLASRILVEDPEEVIDIGCGTGSSTRVLRERWPHAHITGLDNSQEMITRAKTDPAGIEWIVGDGPTFKYDREYEVVFSNAALQWMHDHERLVPRLYSTVKAGGALAVQVPADDNSPIRRALLSVSSEARWSRFTSGCEKLMNYRPAEYYYDILTGISKRLDVWETIYYHVLDSAASLIEWYKGTAMRPFLDKLPDGGSRKEFENEVLAGCRDQYRVRIDGKLLFPFRRIFFVAYK